MADANYTGSMVSEFIIVGFPGLQDRESKAILFAVFLTVYLLILLGNCLLISILAADRRLHTPMYLTICSLAIIDIAFSTTTVPTMLAVFRSTPHTVSFTACFTQTYFFQALVPTESFNLLLMAYDRYVAICHPLHYPARMTVRRTFQLIVVCWLGGFLIPILTFSLAFTKRFCGPNRVLQCFCDYSGVLRLACGDVLSISYVVLFVGLSILLIPLFFIVLSYVKILLSVLRISSSAGRAKAVSTCSSHLLVLSVFFLTTAGVFISYRIPGTSVDMRIMGSVIHNVFPALMNPIIYCLRTKQIRDSLVNTLKKSPIFPGSK
ncbi:olfactory receptor 6N1-like [Amia ocellicauda]|uniref:olfactory receptor 6N1-like n=1 Tax=Amia ocellicauda TaxID=2972642 RepID=UPI003464AF94